MEGYVTNIEGMSADEVLLKWKKLTEEHSNKILENPLNALLVKIKEVLNKQKSEEEFFKALNLEILPILETATQSHDIVDYKIERVGAIDCKVRIVITLYDEHTYNHKYILTVEI